MLVWQHDVALAWQALKESYAQQLLIWETRVAKGQQPYLPYTSGEFLLGANTFYLLFTLALYKYMKHRGEPFKCKPFRSILLLYNFTCVMLAGYVVWGIVYSATSVERKFVCNQTVIPGENDDDHAAFLAHVFWVFYAQKFWEFLDTWFFIMRMSFRQVTFLHVFHHCSINIVVGLILPFEFNGDMFLPILLNAFVHVLMYSHYLVSAVGLPTPWKPYLTSMQLLQFCLIAAQSSMSLTRGSSCGAPFFAKIIMVIYMASMLLLFGNFFLRSYVLKKPASSLGGVMKKPEPVQITKSHSGRVTLDSTGSADLMVPASFTGELLYQITPVGKPMPDLHVSREPSPEDSSFALAGGQAGMPVTWTITMLTLPASPPKSQCCSNLQDADAQWCCNSALQEKKAQ
mmetsp:Transcript_33695/g.60982  ORF Transcript_33695/g.60982 Transcript_33695/m.60982 type:complete len:401 (+) Transcript_33695:63-1265(+)|eukprot:CAMPEP_0197623110 /NCGR_PEP_ID=MMETSP1338-20131121/3182_1 /TAXON_ID=43686 ORGANISM="Pelagodinium beii, Strain RCC1491" /NCGR_SAMPLE_ID=MMETSP1338 /ASSEMBLY_ACC=CAM_ASM_000754 /LENGTH=400 /DNA_ID=CAMNT_0043192975 /DNA_START=57 /DNA_END=1259 /DNA_ORIENTATION=-